MNDKSIEFSQAKELQNWVIVNDTVMGGRSAAKLQIQNKKLVFSGQLSLQNNGGFASTRRVYAPLNWDDSGNIEVTLMGDGRKYQFRIRTNRNWDGVAYVAEFQSKAGELQTFSFELSDFSAQFRGRLVRQAPKLKWGDASQIGFMLADKREGEFVLAIHNIQQNPAIN